MDTLSLDDQICQEQKVWSDPESLSYYENHRRKPEDLYDSERFFLPEVLPKVKTVLDVGCATGGFSRIMQSFNPALRYVGVDISPELIDSARKKYPENEFLVCDGVHFPFKPGIYDLVHCSGVLHLNSQYKAMVKAMWEQSNRYLLCDFRLTWGMEEVGRMDVSFGQGVSAGPSLPYNVLNVNTLMDFFQNLEPRPSVIHAKGYSHSVAPTASITMQNVLMTFCLIEKGAAGDLHMELSFDVK